MSKPLTDEQQLLFDKIKGRLRRETALNSLQGMSDYDAYMKAGGTAKTDTSRRTAASSIMTNYDVIKFLDSVRNTIVKESIMGREEALERLSSLARADMSKLVNFRTVESEDAEGNKVRQAVWDIPDSDDQDESQLSTISEVTAGRDGIKIKQHDPKAAIKILADMEGWNSAQKVEHNIVGDILSAITESGDNGLPAIND